VAVKLLVNGAARLYASCRAKFPESGSFLRRLNSVGFSVMRTLAEYSGDKRPVLRIVLPPPLSLSLSLSRSLALSLSCPPGAVKRFYSRGPKLRKSLVHPINFNASDKRSGINRRCNFTSFR